MFMQKYTYIYWILTDAMNIRRRKTSLTKYLPLTLLQGFEKGDSRFAYERELENEQKLKYFDPHSYGRHVVSSLFSWCSTGGLEAHSAGWWLPLLHLISIFSGPQFIRAPSPFGLVWFSLPHFSPPTGTPTASVQFVGLILPSNSHVEIWTRFHGSAISSDIWRSGCVSSAIFGMACVIVIERK